MSRGCREASLVYPLWYVRHRWDTPYGIPREREETHTHTHTSAAILLFFLLLIDSSTFWRRQLDVAAPLVVTFHIPIVGLLLTHSNRLCCFPLVVCRQLIFSRWVSL